MGKKSSPGPAPPPPDPTVVGKQQQDSNYYNALINTMLGNANQDSPFGSVRYTQNGSMKIGGYDVPQWNRSVTLSPEQQKLYNQQNQIGFNMNQLAIDQSGRLSHMLGQPIVGPDGKIQTSLGNYGQVQQGIGNTGNIWGTFGDAGAIQRSIGPTDYSKDRTNVENAIYSRLNPQLEQSRNSEIARLATQGVTPGTEAYNKAMDRIDQQSNDMRMQTVLAGGSEQSRLAGLALQSGNFANQAQQQAFGQEYTRGQFGNQAEAQRFQEAMARGGFANQAQQQRYGQALGAGNFNNAGIAQQMQQIMALRNQPLNELNALRQGGQMTAPQFQNYQAGNMANTPFGQYAYQSAGMGQDQWNQQMQQYMMHIQGMYGLGSAALGAGGKAAGGYFASDRRVKQDIERVGKLDNGLNVYSFRYAMAPKGPIHIGLMADEVEKVHPEAVATFGKLGIKMVDYGQAVRPHKRRRRRAPLALAA